MATSNSFLPLLGYEGNDGDITASLLREFGGGGGNRTNTRSRLIAMAIRLISILIQPFLKVVYVRVS